MKGLALAEAYYNDVGREAVKNAFGGLYERMAFGLVGEGSECLGYDDEISRDHDWGPGFCIWMSGEDCLRHGEAVAAVYDSLPQTYRGYRRIGTEQGAGRVGVQSIEGFYARYIGMPRAPMSLMEWFRIPEQALATATNGKVFFDGPGQFSGIRDALQAFYPEDVRIKKLAARCALMAQSGQYNFPRCIKRKDRPAAHQAKNEFIVSAISAIHLLNRQYTPFYKWAWRSLNSLDILNGQAGPIEELSGCDVYDLRNEEIIEGICRDVILELCAQGLTDSKDSFLIPHSEAMMGMIKDGEIASLHIMRDR